MRGYLRHRRADLLEMDHSQVARCFTCKIFLPRKSHAGQEKLRPSYVAGKKRGDESPSNYPDVTDL